MIAGGFLGGFGMQLKQFTPATLPSKKARITLVCSTDPFKGYVYVQFRNMDTTAGGTLHYNIHSHVQKIEDSKFKFEVMPKCFFLTSSSITFCNIFPFSGNILNFIN